MLAITVACAKWSDFAGSYGSFYGTSPGESYLLTLADNLPVDNLRQIEKALLYNDYFEYESRQYETGGKQVDQVGAQWICNDISSIKGVVIRCTADGEWTMSRSGDYLLNAGKEFLTEYTMILKKGDGADGHYDWTVTLIGTRREDNGYLCHFWTEDGESLVFSRGASMFWESCRGKIMMEVTRNGRFIDKALLDFKDGKDKYVYINGLRQ